VDLCYDHFLYRHWQTFADVLIDEFIARAYEILMTHRPILPGRLQMMVPVMIREDWLGSFQNLSGVEQALNRLSKRLSNGERLTGAVEEIKRHYQSLEADFLIFFPDLIRFVQKLKSAGY